MVTRWFCTLLCCLLPCAMAADIRLAVGLTKLPYVESGGGSGLEAALAIATLGAAGYKVQVLQLPQARGLAMLREGLVDAMITLAPSAGSNLHYSQPLLYYRNRAIVLRERGIVLRQVADLAHYSVASFQNARLLFGHDFAAAVEKSPMYSEHADQDTLNRMLLNHRVDVVISDEFIFHANPTQHDRSGNSHATVSYALFGNSPRHVGFSNQRLRQQFDQALQQLRADGRYERIVQRYRERYQLPN